MNAERLLQHYEKIADAPDAIARLRRFILDLAVRGKLVPQEPNDEPASELLKRIAKERAERISRGEMRNGKLSAVPIDFPFELPSGWVWLRLGETGNIFSGNSINEPTREQLAKTQEGRPFIATKDVGYGLDRIDYENGLLVELSDKRFKVARTNSVLICAEGGSAGKKIGLADREICFGNKLIANETWSVLASKFALYAYMSEFFFDQFSSKMKGIIGGISIANFLDLPFPLPPLAEQHRIVAKVDELMGLCDRLEAARAGREMVRDRLAAASLARLNAPDPETFQDDARFALDALPALTARPDQIKRLRQTILNLAIRGKLVPQDRNDEPASELLKQIAKEKARLVETGETKRDKIPSPIGEDDKPFTLPSSWGWCRLRSLATALGDGIHGTPEYTLGTEYHFINGNNLENGRIVIRPTTKTVSLSELKKHKKPLNEYTVLVSINGTLGNVAFYEGEEIMLGKSACYFNLTPFTNKRFVKIVLDSPYFSNYATERATGITIMNLSLNAMNEFPFPLPPLAEQHRIVAKVDALMALCDRLEASLADTAATRRRLLDALLAEALAPVDGRELEAAE